MQARRGGETTEGVVTISFYLTVTRQNVILTENSLAVLSGDGVINRFAPAGNARITERSRSGEN